MRIMLIRHGEEPARGAGGVRADGRTDAASLSVRGWQRAGALVRFFAAPAGAPAPRIVRPAAIVAAASKSDSARPLQTVQPLAAALGLEVDTGYSSDADEGRLAADLAAMRRPALVCWRHDALPVLARALCGSAVPRTWAEDCYDVVWLCVRAGGGWRLHVVPQRLLAGDRARA